jgi:hypothetical protein
VLACLRAALHHLYSCTSSTNALISLRICNLQCVKYADGGDAVAESASSGGALAYAGSTSKRVYTIDLRDPLQVVQSWLSKALVNTLHVYSDGTQVSFPPN